MGVTDFFSTGAEDVPINIFSFQELSKRLDVDARTLIDLFQLKMIYLTLLSGKGIEFDRVRKYNVGEDATRMDWNATARTGKPHIKLFDEERMLDVMILVDSSNSMLLGTTEMVKSQYAALSAGVMAYVGVSCGDRVGMIMFSDEIKAMVEPLCSQDNYYTMLSVLAKEENYGGRKNWDCVPKTISEQFGPDTVLFIISDFIGMSNKKFLNDLSIFSTRFRKVFGIMVRDPRDSKLPEGIGAIYLADPDTGEVSLVNVDSIRKEYMRIAAEEEETLAKSFRGTGQEFFKIYTHEEFVKAFTRYFETVMV